MSLSTIEKIRNIIIKLDPDYSLYDIVEFLLQNPKFSICSACSNPKQHHYGDGGLAQHTLEVIELCLLNKKYFEDSTYIDPIELFLSALYHDSGKIYDYKKMKDGSWSSIDHKKLIYHISRSGIMWNESIINSKNDLIKKRYFEPVLHAILSHHCLPEWKSPVYPQTKVAWLVHLCDQMSSKINYLTTPE